MKAVGARPRQGFTLVELLVTATILALLAGGAVSLAELAAKRSKEQELRIALRQIREAIDLYKQASDGKQIARAADESGYPRTLEELAAGVPIEGDARGGKLYFLRRLPRDPMARSSVPAAETWGLRSFESGPDDPRPGRDIYDVHSLSPDTALDGRPYRQW